MDEKQLQFLFDNYAKDKGFANYGEFKSLMSTPESRKVFFDDSNKELGFKDYTDFETTLGVQKKNEAAPSVGKPAGLQRYSTYDWLKSPILDAPTKKGGEPAPAPKAKTNPQAIANWGQEVIGKAKSGLQTLGIITDENLSNPQVAQEIAKQSDKLSFDELQGDFNTLFNAPLVGDNTKANIVLPKGVEPAKTSAQVANENIGQIKNIQKEKRRNIAVLHGAEVSKQNPELTPIEVGKAALQVADPDLYKAWERGGFKDRLVQRQAEELGIEASAASGVDDGRMELLAEDIDRIEEKYPEIQENIIRHKMAAKAYEKAVIGKVTGGIWTVEKMDEIAKELSPEEQAVYQKYIRPEEERLGMAVTNMPNWGLSKFGSGAVQIAESSLLGIGNLVGARTDKDVENARLAQATDTRFANVGDSPFIKSRITELQRKKDKSADEVYELEELKKTEDAIGAAGKFLGGASEVTGQVAAFALMARGLGNTLSAPFARAGLLQTGGRASAGIEGIAQTAVDIGIKKGVFDTIGLVAVGYAATDESARGKALQMFPDDEDKAERTVFAETIKWSTAFSQLIFRDTKLFDLFQSNLNRNVGKFVKGMNPLTIGSKEFKEGVKNAIRESIDFGKKAASNINQEAVEEVLPIIPETIATSILAPDKLNAADKIEEMWDTYATMAVDGSVVGALGGLRDYRNSRAQLPFVSNLGRVGFDDFTSAVEIEIEKQELAGQITSEQAQEKRGIVEAFYVQNAIVDRTPTLAKMKDRQREKYVAMAVAEQFKKKQAMQLMTVDPVAARVLNSEAAESQAVREGILNGTNFVTEDGGVVPMDEINNAQKEVENLNDDETYTAYVSDINEIPASLRDRAEKVSGSIKTRKSFLGIPYGKETEISRYRYSFTGKEAKEAAKGKAPEAAKIEEAKPRRLAGRLARKPKEEAQPVVAEAAPELGIIQAEPKATKLAVQPTKPIAEMSSEEMYNLSVETKKALKAQDKEFEGKTEEEKEAGGYYDVVDNVEDLRDAATRIGYIEEAENVNDLATSVESVMRFYKNPSEEELAILNAAKKRATELGIQVPDLIKAIIKKVGNRYSDASDAEVMMKSMLERLLVGESAPASVAKIETVAAPAAAPTVSKTPTKDNVTERLNINNPFFKKVSKVLVDLGLIKEYNPETKEGDLIGGSVQKWEKGFAAGDIYFNNDGTVSYIKGGVQVVFDSEGNLISENTKEEKQKQNQIEIQGRKYSIAMLEKTRDSDAFKYKEVTETDPLGNKRKVKRLKTPQELKESTDKINATIDKAKLELAALEAESNAAPAKEEAPKDAKKQETVSETPAALRDVESTAKALEDESKNKPNVEIKFVNKQGYEQKVNLSDTYEFTQPEEVGLKGETIRGFRNQSNTGIIPFLEVAEAYHKAKADGTNPELVKAVEDALTTTQDATKSTPKDKPLKDVESTKKALDGIDLDRFVNYNYPQGITGSRFYADAQEQFTQLKGVTNEQLFDENKRPDFLKTKEQRVKFNEEFQKWAKNNKSKIISEAYHKAKKDGTNPALVKAVEDALTTTQDATKSVSKDKPKAATATETKAGVAEAVQPSAESVGSGNAKGTAAVPVNGSAVSMTSKTDKKPINYYWKNDGWYFVDSRGREVKETAAKQEEITKFFGEVSGKKLAQVAPEFEQELAAIIDDFPDATLEEIMEEVEDSRPEMIATPELRAETEGRVSAMLSPKETPLQKAIKAMQAKSGEKQAVKTKEGLSKVMQDVFGLNEEKADAAAEIAHLMIVNEAKLNGISVAEQYQRYAFAQAEGAMNDALYQAEVWHGSPHSFDRFTTEKMGTGEGAQAFGWGLYFTDLESIGRNYAEKLSKSISSNDIKIGDDTLSNLISKIGLDPALIKYPIKGDKKTILKDFIAKKESLELLVKVNNKIIEEYAKNGGIVEGVAMTEESINRYKIRKESASKELNAYKKAIEIIKDSEDISVIGKSRNLYKVTLHKGKTPAEYDWLVWDSPLTKSQQDKIYNQLIKEFGIYDEGGNLDPKRTRQEVESYKNGKEAYAWLYKGLFENDKEASLFLLRAGIDGVKYPAESIARGANSDTARGFNYVVFDENAVTIEERIQFQNKGLGAQGAIVMQAANRTVYAMTNPNVTTPLHEISHGYFDTLISAAENGNAQAAADVKVFAEQAGVNPADLRTDEAAYTKAQELFARGFERYLRDGKAPTPELQSLFDKFKNWLLEIYKSLSESPIDVPINDAMRAVYGRMLTPEQVKQDFPPKPPVSKPLTEGEKEGMIGITHAETAQLRVDNGMPAYEKSPKDLDEINDGANELIDKGFDFEKAIQEVIDGDRVLTPEEQNALAKYIVFMQNEVEKNPTNENSKKWSDAIFALETNRSQLARGLGVGKYGVPMPDSLAKFLNEQKYALGVGTLEEERIKQNQEEYEAIKKAAADWEAKYNDLKQKAADKAAQENVNKKRNEKKSDKPRTKDDILSDRKKILDKIKEDIEKARKGKTININGEDINIKESNIVPYMAELLAIAKHIPAMMENYIEAGIFDVKEMAKRMKGDLEGTIPDITEEDVRALIAGEIKEGKNKPTKQEIKKQIYDARLEMKLINELEKLNAGVPPKTLKAKEERERKFEKLREQIKRHKLNELPNYKKKVLSQIKKLENDLASGNFSAPPPAVPIVLDEEAKQAKRKLIELKKERQIRLLKEEYEARSKKKRVYDAVIKAANVPRTLLASVDYSAPLRQGLIATLAYPQLALWNNQKTEAGKSVPSAMKAMFKASLKQSYMDEWFFDLSESGQLDMMRDLGLGIADPDNPFLAAKEEAFMSGYVEQVEGYIGEKVFGDKNVGLVKGSERAYVMYLNKLRADIFQLHAQKFMADGRTPENSPKLYEQLAAYINNITGRGNLGQFETFAPVLNAALFSAKFLASRINLLLTYPISIWFKEPEIRKMYLKDMGITYTVIAVTLMLFKLALDNDDDEESFVEIDPRSSDFLQIRKGEKRWDVTGNMAQYYRTLAQVGFGARKSTTTGEISEFDPEGAFGESRGEILSRFVRNKFSPVASTTANLITGRTTTGEKVTLESEIYRNVIPITLSQMIEGMQKDGAMSFATETVPSTFGIGFNQYGDRPIEMPDKIKIGKKTYKLSKKHLDELQDEADKQLEKEIAEVEKQKEWPQLSRPEKQAVKTLIKRKIRKELLDDFGTKNRADYPEETADEIRARIEEEIKKDALKQIAN